MKNSNHNNVVDLDTPGRRWRRICYPIQFASDSSWLKYTGDRDDLIAEGLATPDMFPEGRKRVRRDGESSYSSSWEVRLKFGDVFELRMAAPELLREVERADGRRLERVK